MQIWSSWQGYGCLTHACTGVYILCSRSRSIPIGCMYVGTSWQIPVKAVLLLFRPQDAQIEAELTGCSLQSFTLGTVQQYHPHATETMATLRFAQQRKFALKYSWGLQIISIILIPNQNSSEIHLIIHSDQTTKLSKAWAVTFLVLPALLPMKFTPCQAHFLFDIYQMKDLVQNCMTSCDKR
jgi:hypothetical protein